MRFSTNSPILCKYLFLFIKEHCCCLCTFFAKTSRIAALKKFQNQIYIEGGFFSMIIKTEDFELEISIGRDVYFGSRTSGQIFKKWDDLKNDEKLELRNILQKVQHLILESEGLLLETHTPYTKGSDVSQPMSTVSYLAG
jgi:hypothetical protein